MKVVILGIESTATFWDFLYIFIYVHQDLSETYRNLYYSWRGQPCGGIAKENKWKYKDLDEDESIDSPVHVKNDSYIALSYWYIYYNLLYWI